VIIKDYLTFDDLLKRWNCEKRDVHYLIANGDLVPSIVWDEAAIQCHWEPDTSGNTNSLLLVSNKDEQGKHVVIHLHGWVYLRLPTVYGPYSKYRFSYASTKFGPIEEFDDTPWYRLVTSRYDLSTASANAEWIESNAVFMMKIVDSCETFWQTGLLEMKNPESAGSAPAIEAIPGDAKASTTIPASRAHVSDKLAKMNQAAAKWWANANRYDRGTHPDNATVTAWLVEQGFSQTLAASAATIIRPEWVPTGRKPEE